MSVDDPQRYLLRHTWAITVRLASAFDRAHSRPITAVGAGLRLSQTADDARSTRRAEGRPGRGASRGRLPGERASLSGRWRAAARLVPRRMPEIPQLVAAIDSRLADIAAEISALDAAKAQLAAPRPSCEARVTEARATRSRCRAARRRPCRRWRGWRRGLEQLLADVSAGSHANATAKQAGVGQARALKLLHELGAAGQVRRSGSRRSTVWQSDHRRGADCRAWAGDFAVLSALGTTSGPGLASRYDDGER